MKLFFAYLRQRAVVIIAFLLFFAIFAVSFILYHLPLQAVLYPALLCAVLGIVIMIFDYLRVWKNHKILTSAANFTEEMIASLPPHITINEKDYQDIIIKLVEEIAQLQNSFLVRYRDTVDYYTLWVHQIKTPIASMRLTLENEDSPLSRKLNQQLFRIEQYVEMVLAYLRLDSSSTDYVFKEHEIDAVVKQAVKKFASEFINEKITLEYAPLQGKVITDDKWLSFVIEQILSNSLKYTKEGKIRIYMKEPLLLCIEDTGIGIAPQDLPRIFEKGYTGLNGRTDKKASGIGLYLCKRICDNLGVKITAYSQLDKGTAICLDLRQYELKKD